MGVESGNVGDCGEDSREMISRCKEKKMYIGTKQGTRKHETRLGGISFLDSLPFNLFWKSVQELQRSVFALRVLRYKYNFNAIGTCGGL